MPPTQPSSQFNWRRFSKSLSLWLLVILVPVVIIQLSGTRNEPAAEMDYTDYRQQLDANNILQATVQDGSIV